MNAAISHSLDGRPEGIHGAEQMGHLVTGGLDLSHGVALYLEDITVSFDGFRALNQLNLAIDAGELRCIIGPNGAGKTTMMDVITGKTRPDAGRAFFDHIEHATETVIASVVRIGDIPTRFQPRKIHEEPQPIPPMLRATTLHFGQHPSIHGKDQVKSLEILRTEASGDHARQIVATRPGRTLRSQVWRLTLVICSGSCRVDLKPPTQSALFKHFPENAFRRRRTTDVPDTNEQHPDRRHAFFRPFFLDAHRLILLLVVMIRAKEQGFDAEQLVTQQRSLLELQVLCAFSHLFLEALDLAGQLLFAHCLIVGGRLGSLQLANFGRLVVNSVDDVANPLAHAPWSNPMRFVESHLLRPPALRLLDRPTHRIGNSIRIKNGGAFKVPGSAPNRLDQGALRTQEALLVGVQNRHQRDFWNIQAFA